MGVDIGFVVERANDRTGQWELVPRPGAATGSDEDWYDDRSYECFSLLTGLDFSARLLRPLVCVAELRGWPNDLSPLARSRLEGWGDDTAFGRSWLDVSDFRAFDWDARVMWTYMASPPPGLTVTDEIRREVGQHARQHGRPPAGWSVAAWSQDGFEVTVPTTPRQLAAGLLEVVHHMEVLAGDRDRSVRCVFGFTQ